MRILFVANTLPSTDISGVGEQVVQLAAGLEALGHEVRILGRGTGGVRGPKLLFPLTVLPVFLRILRQFRPDVVQVHESDGALVAWLVRTVSSTLDPSPRVIALLQVSYLEEIRAVRTLRWQGRVLGRPGLKELWFRWLKAPIQVGLGCLTAWIADQVLAPSEQTASEIERDYRVTGVDVLPNVTGARGGGSRDPEFTEPGGYLLFLGRLRIRKGVEVLLHALAQISSRHPDLDLWIVGGGEHRERLEGACATLGLETRVTFKGPCAPEVVPKLMAGSRALIVPSIYEGMPLVIVEAMREGLPVVASRVSGIPEVVLDGETGWLVPPEDVDALASVLEELAAEPEEAVRRGRLGRERVERLATPEEAAKRWFELISANLSE